ncbi:MAG: dihydroorotate dehydrogenase electron transfer subunit [bacterium]
MVQISALIIDKKQYGLDGYVYRFQAPELAQTAKPGQFVMLRWSDGVDPLLRRPFSFHRINQKEGTIDILFRVVGKGTALLAEKKVEESCNLLGPLGNGFEIRSDITQSIILAGGMGVAPMLALADRLVALNIKPLVFLGAKSKEELWCSEEFQSLGCDIHLATDDGSLGFKGTVLDLFQQSAIYNPQSATVYGCGPEPMLQQLAKLAQERQFDCQISLETNMACGIGTCQGCVTPVVGPEQYKLVCKDGPVFDSKQIKWS